MKTKSMDKKFHDSAACLNWAYRWASDHRIGATPGYCQMGAIKFEGFADVGMLSTGTESR